MYHCLLSMSRILPPTLNAPQVIVPPSRIVHWSGYTRSSGKMILEMIRIMVHGDTLRRVTLVRCEQLDSVSRELSSEFTCTGTLIQFKPRASNDLDRLRSDRVGVANHLQDHDEFVSSSPGLPLERSFFKRNQPFPPGRPSSIPFILIPLAASRN